MYILRTNVTFKLIIFICRLFIRHEHNLQTNHDIDDNNDPSQIMYDTYKLHIRMKNQPTPRPPYYDTASTSSFAESNQTSSSAKSGASTKARPEAAIPDDSDDMSLVVRKRRRPRRFEYLDDVTLQEYPATSDAKVAKRSERHTRVRNDLKENLDPEISSSSCDNTLEDASAPPSNAETQSADESNGDSSQHQRRSSRSCVRYFRSVVQQNGDDRSRRRKRDEPNLANATATKRPKPTSPTRDKHLKNVNTNDLDFDREEDADFKVSIDLHKIKNLIEAKPDLFSKASEGVTEHAKHGSDRLMVRTRNGAKRFLVKSRSFECLRDVGKFGAMSRTKSMDNLMRADETEKGDKRRIRRSLRRRTKEKHECVR